MRGLFSGDWQADWSNLSNCDEAWAQCLDICRDRGLEFIFLVGDLKDKYNPIDIRIIKFWHTAIRNAVRENIQVYISLGNHDRVGMYTDAQNWLSVLARAGATCFDKPGVQQVSNGNVYILPYTTSAGVLKTYAKRLAKQSPNPGRDVLVFHSDLKGCQYNKFDSRRSDAKFTAQDLFPDRYLACIGGHIHLHQKISTNVYYTGSPFPCDWGEANQQKGFIVVEGSKLSFLPSKIPGWFDPSWPGFNHSQVRKGSRVRIHVKCTPAKFTSQLELARSRAERDFPGATIFTVPQFENESTDHVSIKVTDSDLTKIKAYVEQQIPQGLESDQPRIITYLNTRLQKVGGNIRYAQGTRFVKAKTRNFLSYKNLDIDYRRSGVVVVSGINQDWSGRSNGSGKTSYLQPIPVAMFGRTFKDQKHDGWARRHSTHEAFVKLYMRNARGDSLKIERTRRPSALKFYINGVDQSSGRRGDSKDATQGLIEQATGFTWQTLANAVYIDQSVTHAFLSGTRKARTDILSRFQNLQRFDSALGFVREDKKNLKDQVRDNEQDQAVVASKVDEIKDSIRRLRKQVKAQIKDQSKVLKVLKGKIKIRKAVKLRCIQLHKLAEKTYSDLETKYAAYQEKLESQITDLQGELNEIMNFVADSGHLNQDKTCPTCLQNIDHVLLHSVLKKHTSRLYDLRIKINEKKSRLKAVRDKVQKAEDKYDEARITLRDASQALESAEENLATHSDLFKEERNTQTQSVQYYRHKLRTLQRTQTLLWTNQGVLERQQLVLDFCETAFSRDGIPAFLNAQLCPVLNKSAEYYARLFGDSYIQVRFTIEDGEFEPIILNASGGERIDDQSVGEKALAGLITSFALREVAPVTNLLILDEPGDGLDATNARQFARALPELQKRFGTIFVTSHNPNILQELSNEHVVKVEKHRGISRITQ